MHGQTLYARAREPKVFYPMPDTDHNEVLLFADEDYWRAVDALVAWMAPGLKNSER